MFATSKTESHTSRSFAKKFRHYAEEFHIQCFPIRSAEKQRGKNADKSLILGEATAKPATDLTYVFSHSTMEALTHVIEDMAGDAREGELMANFHNMENFRERKKRYIELAKDLDAVRVWGEGLPPKNCPRIDFITTLHSGINRYWLILFESSSTHAVLICRQINQTNVDEQKLWLGFYSFNPFVVNSIRRSFALMNCGLDAVLHRWEKDHQISQIAIDDLEKYLKDHPEFHACKPSKS